MREGAENFFIAASTSPSRKLAGRVSQAHAAGAAAGATPRKQIKHQNGAARERSLRNQAAAERARKPPPTTAKSTYPAELHEAGQKSTVQGGAPTGGLAEFR